MLGSGALGVGALGALGGGGPQRYRVRTAIGGAYLPVGTIIGDTTGDYRILESLRTGFDCPVFFLERLQASLGSSFLPVTGTPAALDASFRVTAPLLAALASGSRFSAAPKVRANLTGALRLGPGTQWRFSATYRMPSVVTDFTSSFRYLFATSVVGRYRMSGVWRSLAGKYSLFASQTYQHSGQYQIKDRDPVITDFSGVYRVPLGRSVASSYKYRTTVPTSLVGYSTFMSPVRASLTGVLAELQEVKASQTAGYKITSSFEIDFTGEYGVLALDRVRAAVTGRYHVLPTIAAYISTDLPILLLEGRQVEIAGANVSVAEDEYVWTCDVQLTNYSDFALFPKFTPFTLLLGGDTYQFMVAERTRTRNSRDSSLSVDYAISGTGSQFVLTREYGSAVTKTWETSTMASAIAAELAAYGPVPLTWEAVDWALAAFAFTASGVSAMELIEQLAKAVGAVIHPQPDGALVVRQRYAVATPDYPSIIPDLVFSDIDDNLSDAGTDNGGAGYDAFYVRDSDAAKREDMLEFIPDEEDSYAGVVYVYPAAWRDVVTLTSTAADVAVVPLGTEVRTETELLEVIDGQTSTKYPVFNLVGVAWKDVDLGALYSTIDDTALQATGYSMVEVTYETRYYVFDVRSASIRSAQFLCGD